MIHDHNHSYETQENPLNPGDPGHIVFYSHMQAVCYILCFTSKRFEDSNSVGFLRKWDWTRILNSPLDPLRVDRERVHASVSTPVSAERERAEQ